MNGLTLLARPSATTTDDRPLIAEPPRRGPVLQLRRDDARDLRRDVRPKKRDFPRVGLDEAHQIAPVDLQASFEHVGVFEGGRRDPLVSLRGEARQELGRCRADGGALGGQEVAHAARRREGQRRATRG